MSDTITLTREQWNELFDGLDLIRDRFDSLFEIAAALSALGLDKPAGTITALQDEINNDASRLQMALMRGQETKAPAKTSSLKIRVFGKWLWPLNNSNKEA